LDNWQHDLRHLQYRRINQCGYWHRIAFSFRHQWRSFGRWSFTG
jgi:hypothetical protein